MSMSEEKAIELCKKIIQQNNEIVKQTRKNNDINAMQLTANCDTESLAIETLIEALKKKNKIIDLMVYEISEEDENFMALHIKEIKQYFEKKVDGNDINVGTIIEL